MPTVAAVLIVGATAAVIDIRTRRIPNWLTASAGLAGLVMAATGAGRLSIVGAFAGAAAGFCLMLPGHVFGGTGAGDVKLMATLGTLLGPGTIVIAFLYTAIAGGVLALGFAAGRGRLAATVHQAAQLLTAPAAAQEQIEAPAAHNKFPYGPAIAIGALLAALGGT